MDDLDDLSTLEVFRLEAADHLRNLQKDAVGAGGVPPGAESMARMMRDLHTLKGAARLVEMRAVQALAHAMESVLEAATRAGRPLTKSAVDLFLESLDLLGTMVSRDEAPAPELPAAVARLEAAALALASEAPAEPPEPTGSSAPSSTPHVLPTLDQFAVRVPVERLDRMMALAGELHIVRQRLQRVFRQLQGLGKPIGQIDGDWRAASALYADGTELARARLETLLRGNSRGSGVLRKEFDGDLDGFDEMLGQLERLHQDLGEQIMQARMLPLDYLVEPYPRLVRDLAAQLGKDVRFASEGAGTRVDRDVLEGLREPLLHLIQNAVDHGAESPAERRASGKPPQASILLSARYLGDRLVVEVADDGRGVHVEEVRRLGVERGVVPPGRASRMTRAELLGLLFKRGFSTAAKLTDLSGRGVGLDAVKSAVEKLRGDIELVSTEGAGTRIAIRLPLSVAVTRVLLAKAGSVLWAFPVDHVERLLLVSASDIREGPDGRALALADETPRLVMLNEQLSSGSMTHTVIEEQHVVVL
ncbi:MAG: Hpt domain-containing protein [Candidatus Wallbacteria bacterium]|nr:Hpt domain-containing protein [Candidatus Wallbacteria bacterium]